MNTKKQIHPSFAIAAAIAFIIAITLSYMSYLHNIPHVCCAPLFVIAILFLLVSICLSPQIIKSHNSTGGGNHRPSKYVKASFIALNIVYVLFIALCKYRFCYGIVDIEQILYHGFVSSAGMDFSTVFAISIPALVGGIIFAMFSIYCCRALSVFPYKHKKKSDKHILIFPCAFILLFAICLLNTFPVFQYIRNQYFEESNFISDNYVDPSEANIQFPNEKRNIIYICMESMENTFADKANGGAFDTNLIPEITQLQKENISFSHTNNMGGAKTTYGATYTTASIFAQSFGLPLKIGTNISVSRDTMLPNKTNLFDILEEAGYSQYIAKGSDINFGGLSELFNNHGNVQVLDYRHMIETGFIDESYKVFWGVEDKKLYDYSKQNLETIANNEEPFFFMLQTVDTHNPNGYTCSECTNDFDSQYANVVACASKQLKEFINWVQEQEWYSNTTIIVSGDHCSMKNDFFFNIDSDYERTTINIIINPSASVDLKNASFHNRQFSALDMFPTTLAAIGCAIEGNRIGLGTNLFSNKNTIFEEFGYVFVNEEFRKRTTFYENLFNG